MVLIFFLKIIISVSNDLRKSHDEARNSTNLKKSGHHFYDDSCNATRDLRRGRPLLHGSILSIWQKICINIKHFENTHSTSRHTCKSSTSHQHAAACSLGNTGVDRYVVGVLFDCSIVKCCCLLCYFWRLCLCFIFNRNLM